MVHTVTLCALSIVSTDLTLLHIHAQGKNTYKLVSFSKMWKFQRTHTLSVCTFNEHALTEYSSCCSFWYFALHVPSNLCSLTETEPDNLLYTCMKILTAYSVAAVAQKLKHSLKQLAPATVA